MSREAAEQGRHPVSQYNPFYKSLMVQSANACIDATCGLIDTLHNATINERTGAWWYSLFCRPQMIDGRRLLTAADLVTAAMILILAELSNERDCIIDKTRHANSWRLCLETLKLIGARNDAAEDFIASLQVMKHQARSRSLCMLRSNFLLRISGSTDISTK